jgi:hypothetical protein
VLSRQYKEHLALMQAENEKLKKNIEEGKNKL